jgi:glycosyltransferase involved in cell wall biosynthesis
MFNEKDVSLLVPAHNHARHIAIALHAIRESEVIPGEVVIVDDRSSDDLEGVLNSFSKYFEFNYQKKQTGEGFDAGAVRSLAFEQSKGEIVVFIDGDCIPVGNIIKHYVDSHNMFPTQQVAVVGPRISIQPKELSQACIEKYIDVIDWSVLDSRYKQYQIFDPQNEFERLGYNDIVTRPCLWTCNLSLRRGSCNRAIELSAKAKGVEPAEARLFDEDFSGHWGWEDSYLGICLLYTGTVVVTNKRAVVYHVDHHSNYSHRNDALFYRKLERINQYLGVAYLGIES